MRKVPKRMVPKRVENTVGKGEIAHYVFIRCVQQTHKKPGLV